MRVDEVFKQAASQGTAPVSFEMFPPKGELTLDTAREVAGNLCKLSPSFVSVTCSAGGSGNGATTAPVIQLVLAVVLFVLALVLAVEACQTIFGHKKPAASK